MEPEKESFFGKIIKELIREKGVTRESLIEHLGVDEQTWSNYEKGEDRPDLSMISMIAEKLQIDPLELLTKIIDKLLFHDFELKSFTNNPN